MSNDRNEKLPNGANYPAADEIEKTPPAAIESAEQVGASPAAIESAEQVGASPAAIESADAETFDGPGGGQTEPEGGKDFKRVKKDGEKVVAVKTLRGEVINVDELPPWEELTPEQVERRKKNRKYWILGYAFFTVAAILIIYVMGYAKADTLARTAAATARSDAGGKALLFVPEDNGAQPNGNGIIFYPGFRIEHISYSTLCKGLAERGYFVVLLKAPFNMPALKINAADEMIERQSGYGVENWYIMGHSLGAATAANYAGNNADKVAGLILLAGYSSIDISDSGLPVAVFYGTMDRMLPRDRLEANAKNLPDEYSYIIIEGANHVGFGNYEDDKNDGAATITKEQQQAETIEQIGSWMAGSQ